MLNSQSPIPLYRQLADQIRADIESGVYPVASKIPSETVFAGDYAIGRPTVRQATDLLVRQGRLERRRGSGTFVLPASRSIDLFSLAGTSNALQRSGHDAQLELISNVDDGDWLRIERRATVDGEPVLYEALRFDTQLFAGLENHLLENQSLSALVRDVFFLEPTSATQTFAVIVADADKATQLDVSIGTPLLHVQRELHFDNYSNALHADIICRTDNFEFSQTLYPAQAVVGQHQHGSSKNRNH